MRMLNGTLICMAGAIAVLIIMVSNAPKPSTGPAPRATPSKPKPPGSARTGKAGSLWRYIPQTDGMGRKWYAATLQSSNTVSFAFPYQGIQHGTLVITRRDSDYQAVTVRIEHGQFSCHDCLISVRFDNEPIQEIQADVLAEYPDALFIHDDGFLDRVRTAKVVHIEAPFYREGARTLIFPCDGLKWRSPEFQ